MAALCLVPCILRFGNDALLLLGLGELGFAFLLKHTENVQNAAIIEAAKGHATTAQTFVNDKVAQAQGTAKAKTS